MALCSSHTLAALVAELRERAVAGVPQESLIGWLASLVKGVGIKIHTDKCTTAVAIFRSWGPAAETSGSAGDRTRDASGRIRYRTKAYHSLSLSPRGR